MTQTQILDLYPSMSYQGILYSLFEKYQDKLEPVGEKEHDYANYQVIDNCIEYNIDDDDFEKDKIYHLSLNELTDDEKEVVLAGVYHAKITLNTSLGVISISAKGNPNYYGEIIILDNRLNLPNDLVIGDINNIIFFNTMNVCCIETNNSKKFYSLNRREFYEL